MSKGDCSNKPDLSASSNLNTGREDLVAILQFRIKPNGCAP